MSIPPPSPLSYAGDVAIPYLLVPNFVPGPTNNAFSVPSVIVDPANSNAYMLVSKNAGVAEWINLGNLGPLGPITKLSGDAGTNPITPDNAGDANVIGDGTTISISGDGSHTLTASLVSPVTVPHGGTGDTSVTAYAPICGGTTTTSALQSADTGMSNSGYVLTSNGLALLPTWQAAAGGGGSINIQTFDRSSGPLPDPYVTSYTPSPNAQFIIVEVIGAGAGGGGGPATDLIPPYGAAGGGGGAGEYRMGVYNIASIGTGPQTITIYDGGVGGQATPPPGGVAYQGYPGGDTSFGALITSKGGKGGYTAIAGGGGGTLSIAVGGDGGTGGSGGNIHVDGEHGGFGYFSTQMIGAGPYNAMAYSGDGGISAGGYTVTIPGVPAPESGIGRGGNPSIYWGGGGAGGVANKSAGAIGGGAGRYGAVIVTEFIGSGGGGTPGMTWIVATGNTQLMTSNFGYVTKNTVPANLTTYTLPAAADIGDRVKVLGFVSQTGLWRINTNTGQTIYFGSQTSATTTGYALASAVNDSIELICITANTTWQVVEAIGNITIA